MSKDQKTKQPKANQNKNHKFDRMSKALRENLLKRKQWKKEIKEKEEEK